MPHVASKKPTLSPAIAGWVSTAEQREEAWKFCANATKLHYEERLERWNAELDMTLVFAGLFSTALTAFIVQSYPLLQSDNDDQVVVALAQISAQLDSFSIYPNFVNSTQRATFTPAERVPFVAPGYAVCINGLWFSALICTLSASAIAVLVRQWLHQYSRSLSGTSPDIARLRQYRYDNLLKWGVPEIIGLLPMLLQLALALFLAGLLILLWTLHPAIGILASVLVGILGVFLGATSILPIFFSDCCYQSPQAFSLFLLVQAGVRFYAKLLRVVEQYAALSASWTAHQYAILTRIRDAARASLKRLSAWDSFRSWHTREKPDADAKHAELEQSLALTAYYITLDKSMLNTTVIPCLSDMDALSARMSDRYCALLLDVVEKLPTREWRHWRPIMPFVLIVLALITKEPGKGVVRKVLQAMPRHPQSPARSKLGQLYLLAMSQLVSRRIAPREAFRKMLIYLKHARIDSEGSADLGVAVLDDVEASFPVEQGELELLVDLDKADSVSYYLTGMEYSIKYLLRHRARLERDGISVPQRIGSILRGFGRFLCSSAWRLRRARREAVLWALGSSQLPPLLVQMRRDVHTAALVEDAVTEALREAVVAIENGFLPSSGAIGQQAFSLIKAALRDLESTVPKGGSASAPSYDKTKASAQIAQKERGPTENPAAVEVKQKAGDADATKTLKAMVDPKSDKRHAANVSTTSAEDPSEILNPWQDILGTLDIEYVDYDPTAGEPTPPAGQEVKDVPDSPLPDPYMWAQAEYSSTAASPSSVMKSQSFSVAGQSMLKFDDAQESNAKPEPPDPPHPRRANTDVDGKMLPENGDGIVPD